MTDITFSNSCAINNTQCLHFNGKSSFVSISPGFNLGENYTISTFFKHSGSKENVIFSQSE
jgi:hypothetical protein